MKGVLICGGSGKRLRPLTEFTNKSLLPIYDRPLIEYPLRVLLDAGIREIAVVTGTEHIDQVRQYLGIGQRFNCAFHYCIQEKPEGIAQALGLTEGFAAGDSICAMLGDNIYFDDLVPVIKAFKKGGYVFVKDVPDPERFGVVELSGQKILSIEEKPKKPKSGYVATGCYLYDNRCFDVIKKLKPSSRGELEITDVSKWYLEQGELSATILNDEWVDAGTFESLFRAAQLVRDRSM